MRIIVMLVTLPVALLLAAVGFCQSPQRAPVDAKSQIVIAPQSEPGERLIVTGRVTDADGVTPLKGVSLYVYHTDVKGLYSETNDNANPRLRGYLRTDSQGRYEYSTIKPGSYPSGRVPAHIHYVVNHSGYREKVFEIIFDGDPFIDDRSRNDAKREESVFSLRKLERGKEGVLKCIQDITLRRE